jgi:hypothetical protein
VPDHEVPVGVSPRLRRTVHVFLLVFALAGVAHLELWPFTGFRLFSELRGSERTAWSIAAVDLTGAEHTIELHDLPVAYRNTSKLLEGFDHRSPASRDAVCDAWAEPMRKAGHEVARVRVYELTISVRPGGPPARRRLAYECGSGS